METEKIAQVDPSSTSIDSLLNDEEDQQNGVGLLESSQLTETTSSSIVTEPTNASLTPFQTKFIIVLLVICNFMIANGVSLQGPFYPKEAENKGATPIIYSSIFAIYELVMLITSFIFGNLVECYRPNLMSGIGLTITGVSTTIFGLMTYLHSHLYFIVSSFTLRIIESLGATAFATSSYSFISVCFPDRTATMFAMMETFFGLGVITGPVLGGFLYDLGGFLVPFASTGSVMTICGLIMISRPVGSLFAHGKQIGERQTTVKNDGSTSRKNLSNDVPDFDDLLVPINEPLEENETETLEKITLGLFLSSPIVLIDSFIIITAITLMGFNSATLEPFLRHENITSNTLCTSLAFVAIGASYAFTAILWGKACDRYPENLLYFAIVGSIMTTIGLVLIGPLPFLYESIKPNLWIVMGCMVLFGIGTAAKQVAGYTHALNYTIQRRKFPPNQQTYGYISGMFFSCLSFGGFVGPIIGGLLVENWNYQYATLAMMIIELLVLLVLIVLLTCCATFRLQNNLRS